MAGCKLLLRDAEIERRAHVQATAYLNKLPERFTAEDRVLVVDPMLATGKPLLIPDQVLLP